MDSNHIDINSQIMNKWQNIIYSYTQRMTYYFIHIAFFFTRRLFVFLSELPSFKLVLPPKSNLTAKTIIADGKNLKKIPNHLALIFGDSADYNVIADVLVWVSLIDVPCVTIYNNSGSLESNKYLIESLYNEKRKSVYSENKSISVETSFHKEFYNEKEKSEFNVVVTSFKSMQKQFMGVAKTLCVEIAKANNNVNNLDNKMIDCSIRDNKPSLVDPDLAICLGEYYSFSGYQPWFTRLTEILYLKTSTSLSYSIFFEALQTYAKCQQRLGT